MSEPTKTRFVRGILHDPRRRAFLGLVNSRVSPGQLTVMLPGGRICEGETPLQALGNSLLDELQIGTPLDWGNTKFLMSRTYEFPGQASAVEVLFYRLDLGPVVPLNMNPSEVTSVSWLTLGDVERYTSLDGAGWKVQMGALDALRAVLDPVKTREVDGGAQGTAREVARRDGGSDGETPPALKASAPLPYGA